MDLKRGNTVAAALSCGSFIFLGSNGLMLGGAGGMLALLVLCFDQRCNLLSKSFFLSCALALHFAAFVLGLTAIQFYLTMPGNDWGPSIFGDRVHGAWWWIALTIIFSFVNLLASIMYLVALRRNLNCCGGKNDDPYSSVLVPGRLDGDGSSRKEGGGEEGGGGGNAHT